MGNIAEFVKETFDAAEAARAEAKNNGQEVEVHFDFSLVSNQRNGIASYAEAHTEVFAEGQLFYSPRHFIGGTKFRFLVPAQFTMRVNSDARYYFSDRRKIPPQPPISFGGDSNPFNAEAGKVDKLGLSIVGNSSTSFGPVDSITVTLELRSFGNTHISFQADSLAHVLFGVGSPVGHGVPDAMYLISLFNMKIIKPQPPIK